MKIIDCFIATNDTETVENLFNCSAVSNVICLSPLDFISTEGITNIAAATKSEYTLLYTKPDRLKWVHWGLERMLQVAQTIQADMVYSDHFKEIEGQVNMAPVIDYQTGSLRDDFDFGSLLLIKSSALKKAVAKMDKDYNFAALYDLRLKISQRSLPQHINEYLYYEVETDRRASGEKQFDYVNPKNREVQIEMEAACTEHLKAIGGYLAPQFKTIDYSTDGPFEYEASVIIPCRNRVNTIEDAIRSALNQNTTFKYNVFVVDDNSTDGTVDIIKKYIDNPKFRYIAQDPTYHAIGGNWNAALHHPDCGRFALQLDSDDLYSDENSVQRFV
ncbi:MAG: glycosyltransferase family 2 protein, partial [Bacteroidales bacterium]|nr:glycosyltransferase family 2 protein [Bacteroidales bacterium]